MKDGISKAEAQAQSIAAQIWAEMLGLVCHPEYYKLGEQKVRSTVHPLSLTVGFRHSFFRFPCVDLSRDIPTRIPFHDSKRIHQCFEIQVHEASPLTSHSAM